MEQILDGAMEKVTVSAGDVENGGKGSGRKLESSGGVRTREGMAGDGREANMSGSGSGKGAGGGR